MHIYILHLGLCRKDIIECDSMTIRQLVLIATWHWWALVTMEEQRKKLLANDGWQKAGLKDNEQVVEAEAYSELVVTNIIVQLNLFLYLQTPFLLSYCFLESISNHLLAIVTFTPFLPLSLLGKCEVGSEVTPQILPLYTSWLCNLCISFSPQILASSHEIDIDIKLSIRIVDICIKCDACWMLRPIAKTYKYNCVSKS